MGKVKLLLDVPTPTGKETWRHRTVENILSDEKYKGDARLQKCSIQTAGWFSPSATAWKSAWRFEVGSGRGIGFVPDASGHFFCAWK